MLLELCQLTKAYGRIRPLDEVSLTLPPGQIVAVIGLNGAGKTTLLRCLAGLVAPTSGEVRCNGAVFQRSRLDLRRQMVFLPDFPVLYRHLNTLQHVALMLRVYERDTDDQDDAILNILGELDLLPLAEVPIGTLSRGQAYKAALAGLLAVQPELWLLDEPFASGLDPQGLAVLKQHARTAAAAGATIIYSTQILEIAEKFSDLLCILDHGQLVATHTREELAAMPATGPESL